MPSILTRHDPCPNSTAPGIECAQAMAPAFERGALHCSHSPQRASIPASTLTLLRRQRLHRPAPWAHSTVAIHRHLCQRRPRHWRCPHSQCGPASRSRTAVSCPPPCPESPGLRCGRGGRVGGPGRRQQTKRRECPAASAPPRLEKTTPVRRRRRTKTPARTTSASQSACPSRRVPAVG